VCELNKRKMEVPEYGNGYSYCHLFFNENCRHQIFLGRKKKFVSSLKLQTKI